MYRCTQSMILLIVGSLLCFVSSIDDKLSHMSLRKSGRKDVDATANVDPVRSRKSILSADDNMRNVRVKNERQERELIIGGANAGRSTYPYVVAIVDTGSKVKVPFCGGTLIAKDVVLTAKHCYDKMRNGKFEIQIGRYDFSSKREKVEIFKVKDDSIKQHPGPGGFPYKRDFMLLFLDRASSYPTVQLNDDPNIPGAGQSLNVAGWGTSSLEITGLSPTLQHVDVESMTNEECRESYDTHIHRAHLCAMNEGKDSCRGDSGGPLILAGGGNNGTVPVQVGIVSWGAECAHADFPGVYARISTAFDWIKNTACEYSIHARESFIDCDNKRCTKNNDCPTNSCDQFGMCELKNNR